MIPQQFLEQVEARTLMSALVSRRVKLVRNGREWKACCPVHSEKTPSFTVNDEKGFAHCFGCGFHAGPIRWLTEIEGLDFLDAVRELAEDARLAMPERSAAEQARAARVAGVRPALEAAQRLFMAQLGWVGLASSSEAVGRAKDVQQYLQRRGVDQALAERFGLGLAPEGADYLARAGIGREDALAAGLAWERDGRSGPRFQGRVMVPVHDARGRIVGFGGRLVEQPPVPHHHLAGGPPPRAGEEPRPAGPQGRPPARSGATEGSSSREDGVAEAAPQNKTPAKYINSPDSEIFDKGRLLFNLHRAAPAIRAAKRALVVEGYFDVIALAGAGIAEAVAPMGTALTEAQLARLWRLVRAPVLMFDGDEAGRKAARRACERALPDLAPDRTLKVALLLKGQDPDDVAREGGAAAIEAVVDQALPLDVFLFWDTCLSAAPPGCEILAPAALRAASRPCGEAAPAGVPHDGLVELSPEDRAAVWEQLAALAATIAHEDLRVEYLAAWRARYERLISGVERPGRDAPLHTVVAAERVSSSEAVDDEYHWPEAEDDSEKRLIAIVQRLLHLRADERAAMEPIREERKYVRELAKLAGLQLAPIDAVVKMLEMDFATGSTERRHESESVLVLYRRVLGIEGPLTEALMPVVPALVHAGADDRAKPVKAAPPRAAAALAWHDAGGM